MRSRLVVAGLIAAAITYFAVVVHLAPAEPIFEADSASYLNFSPVRSAGYPLFLKWVGLSNLIWCQTALFAIAVCVLGVVTHRITRRASIAALLVAGLFLNTEVARYHAMVMTESTTVSLEIVVLLVGIGFARAPSIGRAFLLSVAIGAAALVRPTGVALIPAALGLVALLRGALPRRGTVLAVIAVALPALSMISTERLVVAGGAGPDVETSLAARHLFAKAALIDAPPVEAVADDPPLRRAVRGVLEEGAAPIRIYLSEIAAASVRATLTVNSETCLEYACASELLSGIRAAPGELRREMMRAALERMRAAPLDTGRLFVSNWLGLWNTHSRSHPDLAPIHDRYVLERPPPIARFLSTDLTGPVSPDPAGIVIRPAVRIAGLVTLLISLAGAIGIASARAPVSRDWAVAAFAAWSVHLSAVLIAAFGVGIPRYTIDLWPFIAAAGVFALSALWEASRGRAR